MPGGQEFINWTVEDTWYSSDDLNNPPKPVGILRTDLSVGDGYNISQTAVLGISNMLESVLKFNGTGGSVPYDTDTSAPIAKPIFLQPLYDSNDLSATFENIANSMSNALRADADSASADNLNIASMSGRLGYPVSMYKVRWPYLSLPLTLVILGFVFLYLGRRYSRKAGIPAWKSCPIAVLSVVESIRKDIGKPLPPEALHAMLDELYDRFLEFEGLVKTSRESSTDENSEAKRESMEDEDPVRRALINES